MPVVPADAEVSEGQENLGYIHKTMDGGRWRGRGRERENQKRLGGQSAYRPMRWLAL